MDNNCFSLGKRFSSEVDSQQPPKRFRRDHNFESKEIKDKINEIKTMALSFNGLQRCEFEVDLDLKIVVKYDPDANIGKLENEVYQAAIICGKKHLVAPVKSINVPGKDKDVALQLYFNSDEYILLSDYLKEKLETISFEKIAESVLFQFIFGMRVCTEENLILNRFNGDIIHFDNQFSWRTPNNMNEEDGWEIPFSSALLSFNEAHRPLNFKQYEFLREEIENYQSKLNELNTFLINENKDLEMISSIVERISLFQKSLEKSKEIYGHTLADVILSANQDCKKIIYLKLTLLIFEEMKEHLEQFENSSILSFFQKIKKEVFSNSCNLPDCWEDLINEIEDESLNNAIINKISNLFELSLDEFVFEISFFLMSGEASSFDLPNEGSFDFLNEEPLGFMPII